MKRAAQIALIMAIAASIIVLVTIFIDESAVRRPDSSYSNLELIGEYTLDGEIHPLSEGFHGLSGNNSVVINAHFSENIPQNAVIYMRLDNMNIKLRVNGALIYSFGYDDNRPSFIKSSGNIWAKVSSTGISRNDDISIELYNVYTNHVDVAFNLFLDNLKVDINADFAIDLMRSGLINSIYSIAVICIGLLIFIAALAIKKRKMLFVSSFLLGALSIVTGIWFFIDFNIHCFYTSYNVLANALDIISLSLIAIFLTAITLGVLRSRFKIGLLLYLYICSFGMVTACVLQLSGILDYYELSPWITIALAMGILLMLVSVVYDAFKLKHRESIDYFPSIFILALGASADVVGYATGIIVHAMWFKISFFVFLVLQILKFIHVMGDLILENTRTELLRGLAYKDPLTELSNRTAYLELVEEYNSGKRSENFAVAVLDINGLKAVNDKLGHEMGDALILGAGNVIVRAFPNRQAFRIGGDEFVVVLDDTCGGWADELEARLRKVERDYNAEHPDLPKVSLSCGIKGFEKDKDSCFEDTFSRADRIMYEKKALMKAGRL